MRTKYMRMVASQVIGEENIEKLEGRGWIVVDQQEVEELQRRNERLNRMIDDLIEVKRKDIEIQSKNIRNIESVRSQVLRGAKVIRTGSGEEF